MRSHELRLDEPGEGCRADAASAAELDFPHSRSALTRVDNRLESCAAPGPPAHRRPETLTLRRASGASGDHHGSTITDVSPTSVTLPPDGVAPGSVHTWPTLMVWVPASTTSVVTPDTCPRIPVLENTALFLIGTSSTIRK